jgi:hypothetical protein
MNNKYWIILCAIEAIVIFGLILFPKKSAELPQEPIIKEIVRDSIIRDSIFVENEKIKERIVYVQNEFKEDSINIMSSSDSALVDLCSRYIEDYSNK